MSGDPAETYAMAVQAAAEHIQALRRHTGSGRALSPTDVSGLVDILRALAPRGHRPGKAAKADLSGKSVRQMLEDAAKEFPELAEAMDRAEIP